MQPGKKILVKLVDILSIFLLKPKRKCDIEDIERILVLNCGVFGDTLLSFPALASLRKRFPNAHITQVVNPAFKDLWKYNTDYDELIFYKAPWLVYHHKLSFKDYKEWRALVKKIKGYDLAIDLRGDIRSLIFLLYPAKAPLRAGHFYSGGKHVLNLGITYPNLHEVENQLAIIENLGGESAPYRYTIGKSEREKIQGLLLEKKKKRILFFVSPGYASKAWPKENWIELANLIGQEYDIIFAGGPNDVYVPPIIEGVKIKYQDFSGKLTINELAALIFEVDLVIGVDTGPMHLSAAIGKNILTLFGPTDPKRWKPYNKKSVVIKKEKMDEISVKEVLMKAKKILGEEL